MTQQNEEFIRPELIRGDTYLRYKWLAVTSIFIVFTAGLLWALPSAQEHLLELFSDSNSNSINTFSLLTVFYSFFSLLAILLITAGLQLFLTAGKTLRCGYYPAHNARVICDTWLVRGPHAILMSCLMMITGLLFFIVGGYVPYYFHKLLLQLLAPVG
jgi:uncharacterized membrane protein